ncbi:hypothetical protein D2Q93_15515 [Alicyclobacillaceae bacterium I2511]|nr:hypothetical protein D2Q93_15515 [Alicyclobacillaceae bacterium I2511]
MTYRIVFKALQINASNANAAVVIGDARVAGWDGSIKYNAGQGAVYGHHNLNLASLNLNLDTDRWLDSPIVDADCKATWRLSL